MAKYFSPVADPKLFSCSCGLPTCDAPPPSDTLLRYLDELREAYGQAIMIDSGPRCTVWNAKQGGEDPSAHVLGEAADIACVNSVDRFELLKAAYAVGLKRLGIGSTFVHVDVTQDRRFLLDVMWHYYGQLRKPM